MDWTDFIECVGGPEVAPNPLFSRCVQTCLDAFDFDLDGDVDMEDAAAFGNAFGLAIRP